MLKEPALPHLDLSLNVEVASLAERRQVPLLAIRFIIVQVMYGQRIPVLRIVWVPTAFTLVASRRPESVSELLGPCFGICAYEFAHENAGFHLFMSNPPSL
jgi:hypothetical protein